ncbi:P-loop containing nucleoside triphosphate hydrolase protein [Aspergillus stella-maris]|uniref:P-loop containing nucleoside triphosphate hydrolase protein n=1 Tax=Aspergillus stella-maris TaxID=1810926 RepID=UPI003CCE198C
MEKLKPEKHHWMVPFRKNPGFMGREGEIAQVEELFGKVNGPFKVALYGLGGVGKTQIALELAYRVRERDPICSVFWIPCTSNASVEQAFMGIAQTIGLQEVKLSNAKERVKAYLSPASGRNWLLIFDSADDMDMWIGDSPAATELADFLLPSKKGHILSTIRNRKLAVRLASPFVVDVSEPDAQTSVMILEAALQRKELLENRDETITILEHLTFLPLAITQAAAYINSNGIEISDYISLLEEQESDIVELLSEDYGDDGRYQNIQNPVATTWLISFQQIQRLNPLAADYLSFMACINPREIPQFLLPDAPSKKKKLDAIGLLKAFSFVNHEHKNQKTWRGYLPHAILLMNESDFQKERESFKKLVQNIGRCLRADGRYHEAAALFEDIVRLQRTKGGDTNDPSAMDSMADLALTYDYQGRWKEAEELGVQVMEVHSQVLGTEHPYTLTNMANLASTLCNQGRWHEAEKLEVQVLETKKTVLGAEHPDTLTSMANLASIYWNRGRWDEAEKQEVQVIETLKTVLGAKHPNTLTSMANLASTLCNQGRWDEAEKLNMQVMETSKTVLGPEHPSTLTSMNNLAHTWHSQQKFHDALALMEECLTLRKEVLGPSHPDFICSSRSLRDWKDCATFN